MFFVAYTQARRPDEPARPLTFLWNGGPGSSSSLVHLLGFGPTPDRRDAAPIDNQGTWLELLGPRVRRSDRHGLQPSDESGVRTEFYQTRGDAESVAEFIRVYRNQFDAWDAPVVLAGESYGVTRRRRRSPTSCSAAAFRSAAPS